MSHLMIRRVLAGVALVALLAAPAQAAGFGRTAGAPDPWTLAWSCLVRLWGGEVSGSRTPQATTTVQKQLPAGDDSTDDSSGDQTDPTTGGDKGMGIDPDG